MRRYTTVVTTIYRHVIENKDGSDFNELAVQILEGHSKMALIIFNFFPNLSLHTRALFFNDFSCKRFIWTFYNLQSLFSLKKIPRSWVSDIFHKAVFCLKRWCVSIFLVLDWNRIFGSHGLLWQLLIVGPLITYL